MTKQLLSPGRIERLKRDAKAIKRTQCLSHIESLNRVARSEGYASWNELVRRSAPAVSAVSDSDRAVVVGLDSTAPTDGAPPGRPKEPDMNERLRKACIRFIRKLDDSDIDLLARNGSLWVDMEDILAGGKRGFHLHALGPADSSVWREIAVRRDLIKVVDFEGLGESFTFEGEKDDDDDGDDDGQPYAGTVWYSSESARRLLLESFEPDQFAAVDDMTPYIEAREDAAIGRW